VHVGLQPDRVDPDAGFEHPFDQTLVRRAEVEVVEHQSDRGVGRAGLLERHPHHGDTAPGPGEAGDGVVPVREHRHDHGLVDGVPQIDHAGESADELTDPVALQPFHLGEIQVEQPRWLHRVPDQRVAFDGDAAVGEPACGSREPFDVGRALPRLVGAPIERQGRRVEQVEPQVTQPVQAQGRRATEGRPGRVGWRTTDQTHEVETDVAERKRVPLLGHRDDPVGQRPAVRPEHGESDLADPVLHALIRHRRAPP
jgi:hypothetical protein